MREDFKASRRSSIKREIYLMAMRLPEKLLRDPHDEKDILAACDLVADKLGPSFVMEILGKCGVKRQEDLPVKEYARFLRLCKDYLNSV